MTRLSEKAHERLLYLISPIGLLLLWQVLVMLGFGDRRFIPTPSDIAVRFWQLTINGELELHTVVTLWRVLAGYFIGVIPAIAIGLFMAMFRPVRIFFARRSTPNRPQALVTPKSSAASSVAHSMLPKCLD